MINNEKEELRKEIEQVVKDRKVVFRLLKNERDSLKLEKKAIWDQHKQDIWSLNHKREDFMSNIEQEHFNGSKGFFYI